ncbi:MAG: hypothetical protein Q8O38_16890 [Sulfurimicrobium sp.]|nr:hypothetical protein [Sulfurimicrobium sp.]
MTYKPGGAIAKGLDIALKMQRVMPVAEVHECRESPPLVGAWRNPGFNNYLVSDIHLDISCGEPGYFMYFKFVTTADIVAADFGTAVGAPLFIDISLIEWDVVAESYPYMDEFNNSIWHAFSWLFTGSSLLVFAEGYSIGGSGCNEIAATISATPIYNGVRLPTLTMSAIWRCW